MTRSVIVLVGDLFASSEQALLIERFSSYTRDKLNWLHNMNRERNYIPIEYIGEVDAWIRLYSLAHSGESLCNKSPFCVNQNYIEISPSRERIAPFILDHPLSMSLIERVSILISLRDKDYIKKNLESMKCDHRVNENTIFEPARFSHIEPSLTRDKQVMLQLIRIIPSFIMMAEDSLFDDFTFVSSCIEHASNTFKDCCTSVDDSQSDTFFNDPFLFFDTIFTKAEDVLLENPCLVKKMVLTFGRIDVDMIDLVHDDEECMLILIRNDSQFFDSFSNRLANDEKFMMRVVKERKSLANLLEISLFSSSETIEWLVRESLYTVLPEALKQDCKWAVLHLECGHDPSVINSHLYESVDFITECIKKGYPVVSFIESRLATGYEILSLIIDHQPHNFHNVEIGYISQHIKKMIIQSKELYKLENILPLIEKDETFIILYQDDATKDELISVVTRYPRTLKYMNKKNSIEICSEAVKRDPFLYDYCGDDARSDPNVVNSLLSSLSSMGDRIERINNGLAYGMWIESITNALCNSPLGGLSIFIDHFRESKVESFFVRLAESIIRADLEMGREVRDLILYAPSEWHECLDAIHRKIDHQGRENMGSAILPRIVQNHQGRTLVDNFRDLCTLGSTTRIEEGLEHTSDNQSENQTPLTESRFNLHDAMSLVTPLKPIDPSHRESPSKDMLEEYGYWQAANKQALNVRLARAYPSLLGSLHFDSIFDREHE